MVARRGIAVYTGSADTVHKFLDDGSSAIGNDADSICTVTGQLSASQGLSGTYIYGDGSKLTNVVASEIEAAGATGDIQFNLDDDLAADTGVFTYVNATDTLGVLADGGSFALGGDSDVTLTHDGGTGATLASVGAFVVDGADAVTVDSDAALTLGGASLDVDADGGAIDIDATAAVSIDSSAGSVTHLSTLPLTPCCRSTSYTCRRMVPTVWSGQRSSPHIAKAKRGYKARHFCTKIPWELAFN